MRDRNSRRDEATNSNLRDKSSAEMEARASTDDPFVCVSHSLPRCLSCSRFISRMVLEVFSRRLVVRRPDFGYLPGLADTRLLAEIYAMKIVDVLEN